MEFYREQQPFYQTMVDRYEETVSQVDYVDQLEIYYGQSQASYTIILAPLSRRLWPSSRRGPGCYDVYNISGPYDVAPDGVPTFGVEELAGSSGMSLGTRSLTTS